jgi:hypothetical protein
MNYKITFSLFSEKKIVMVFPKKKYSEFGGGKNNNLVEFLSYNLMLNSGEKNCALCATKKINILTRRSESVFLYCLYLHRIEHPFNKGESHSLVGASLS